MGRFQSNEEIKAVVVPKSDQAKERIRKATNKNFLFMGLEEDQRRELEDVMFEVEKQAGSVIIKQGEEGDNFYILESGSCEVIINNNKVAEIEAPASFGELALMYNTPRAATVRALTHVRLWAIGRPTFRKILLISTLNRRKKFESFLAKVPILQSLTPYERATISDALKSKAYKEGEVVIHQGEFGEEFYIVESGSAVMLHAPDPDVPTAQEEIGRLHAGEYFGEVALIKDQPRACTIAAIGGPLKVVYLDRATFVRLMGPLLDVMKRNMTQYKQLEKRESLAMLASPSEDNGPRVMPTKRRGGVSASPLTADPSKVKNFPVHPKDAQAQNRIRKAIMQNPLFNHINEDQLKTVVDAMFERQYNAGDLIIRQGDDGDNYYVLDSGSADIIINNAQGTRTVGTLQPGQACGELALLYHCPRAATIRANTRTVCWAVDGETFRFILASSAMSQRKKYEAFLAGVPILGSLTDWERSIIADALQDAEFKPGEVILRQGDAGNNFYIVERGECVASISNGVSAMEVKHYGPGDYFGEIALLTDAPRKASVIAKTPVKCVYLDRGAFSRLLGNIDDILKRNMQQYRSFAEIAAHS